MTDKSVKTVCGLSFDLTYCSEDDTGFWEHWEAGVEADTAHGSIFYVLVLYRWHEDELMELAVDDCQSDVLGRKELEDETLLGLTAMPGESLDELVLRAQLEPLFPQALKDAIADGLGHPRKPRLPNRERQAMRRRLRHR